MKKARIDVFGQLGFDERESAALRLRSEMMDALIQEINRQKLTQSAAGKRLGVSQPRVSGLMRGKLHLFSVDMLITFMAALGLEVHIKVRRA
jgi:predicted XRE-type DNA-binding protein